MIRYALKCREGHLHDAWFRNAETFDRLRAEGAITCAVCGCPEVEKALMAPAVSKAAAKRSEAAERAPQPGADAPAASPAPQSAPQPAPPVAVPAEALPPPVARAVAERAAAITALRQAIEAQSENVGRDFPAEARRIHHGEAEARPILGEASPAEAKALIEEEIPILPVPWVSKHDA
ncbi:MAG: DUF1178 family protein [Pseudomonadota bacterium]